MTCGALLLAAGRSARMAGGHKLLEAWQDKPLVAHAADALLAAGLPLMVVTGHAAAAIEAALARRSLRIVHAADYALGIAHSLRAGLSAVPADWDAVLVALADMPQIEPDLLARLAAADGLAVPVFDGRRGNPVRWPRNDWPQLMALEGDEGARRLLVGRSVAEVPAPSEAIFADVDDRDALARLRGR